MNTRRMSPLSDSTADQKVSHTHPFHVFWKGVYKAILFAVSLLLFILALELMKRGARDVAPLLESRLGVDHPLNALGFGWLAACLLMSGSPVAAISLTFLDAHVLDRLQSLFMITGSRLGASFVVLFIGFLYILRRHERQLSGLTMGLLSLIVTGSIYLPALIIGSLLLEYRLLDAVQPERGLALASALERAFEPVVDLLAGILPNWGIFLVGLGLILASFALFDRALPNLHLEQSRFAQVSRLLYRPWVMFALGSTLTLLTLSVSVSLGLLVPLSARGYIRRENAIPYIMGANLTTFVDTLLAAVLLGNADAFTIVLVSMISVALVSLIALLFFFRRYEQALLRLVAWIGLRSRNLALFMGGILVTATLLLLV